MRWENPDYLDMVRAQLGPILRFGTDYLKVLNWAACPWSRGKARRWGNETEVTCDVYTVCIYGRSTDSTK